MGPKGEPGECELLSWGTILSSRYHLCLPEGRALPVFCDMDIPGGVCLVSQDGSVDFFRSWSSYKAGFGSQEPKFWPGNDNLHELTLQGIWERHDFNGNCTFVTHYQLVLGKFSEGSAGDGHLSYHNVKSFTTYDDDHDISGSDCAVTVHGAWWCGSCYQANLNRCYAMYQTTALTYGIDWVSGLSVGLPYHRVCMMLC
uniref:Ficolin 3 n=1 Tax=Rhinolophus ferrumequinum TaxID=59479 RepID=A0A671EAI9_RHIFE